MIRWEDQPTDKGILSGFEFTLILNILELNQFSSLSWYFTDFILLVPSG